jgi:hypothetical protein
MKHAVWWAGCLSLPLAATAQVYRCEVNGVTEYSDRPCAAQAERQDLPPISIIDEPADNRGLERSFAERQRREREAGQIRREEDARWVREHDAREAEARRLREARVERRVTAGMDAAEVRRLLGEPQRVVTQENKKGQRIERWTYQQPAQTVTLEDGIVIRVTATRKSKTP